MSKASRFFSTALAAATILAVSTRPAQAQAPQYHAPVVAANDTLAGVDYNYRYELYGGFAYSHFDAGPSLLQGSNLGGIDIRGARFFNHKWAAAGSVRGYLGTSGVTPNVYGIKGPFVSQYMFMAGPEYRALSNAHASVTLHALFGGSYGRFDSDLTAAGGQTVSSDCLVTTGSGAGSSVPPGCVGLFNNQTSFGSAIGGSIDLNRSPRLAFRISPEALLTDYSANGKGDFKEQFGLSVGVVYRLGHHITPTRPGAPHAAVGR